MRLKQLWWSGFVAAMLIGLMGVTAGRGGGTVSPLSRRPRGCPEGAGIPHGNGFIDYVTLLNERDGGINGVPLVWEECETVYDVDRGMECYERLKAKGPTGAAVLLLFGTPLIYALTGAGHA